MKRSSRIWIGAVAAIATFASLVAFAGMRHHRYGMHHHRNCMEQCDSHSREVQKPASTPSATPAAKPAQPDTAR